MHCRITYRLAALRLLMFAVIWLCGSGSLHAQTLTTLYLFGAGGNPDGGLIQGTDGKLYGVTAGGPAKYDGMVYAITTSGTFTALHGGGGEYQGELVQGTDGNFYGTVLQGVSPTNQARTEALRRSIKKAGKSAYRREA